MNFPRRKINFRYYECFPNFIIVKCATAFGTKIWSRNAFEKGNVKQDGFTGISGYNLLLLKPFEGGVFGCCGAVSDFFHFSAFNNFKYANGLHSVQTKSFSNSESIPGNISLLFEILLHVYKSLFNSWIFPSFVSSKQLHACM